jgi:superfamily II DNA or RNA helicase
MTRDDRQEESKQKWRYGSHLGAGIGTIEGCTGYGKTRVALNIINSMLLKTKDLKILIVLPTITLKNQWLSILNSLNLKQFCELTVVNGLVERGEYLDNDFTIYDEIHTYIMGDEFSKVFQYTDSKYKLGLTGTLKEEQREKLELYCPVVDTIPVETARKNGWVADFIEYNWYVPLYKEEQDYYDSIEAEYKELFRFFDNDFFILLGCKLPHSRDENGRWMVGAKAFAEKKPVFVNDKELHGVDAYTEIISRAKRCDGLRRERLKFLQQCNTKLDAAETLIKTLNLKTAVFGESTEAADILDKMLGDKSAVYHTYIKGQKRPFIKKDFKKTKDAAQRLKDKLESLAKEDPEKVIPNTINWKYDKGYHFEWKYLKSVGKSIIKEEIIEKLEKDLISWIVSAKALDLGLDVSGMTLAVMLSWTRDFTRYEQRRGRVIRQEEIEGLDKKTGYVVNIIAKGTSDESTIKSAQKNSKNVRHVYSLEDILIYD